MFKQVLSFSLLLSTISSTAFSYLPDLSMILDRTAMGHGKSAYNIEMQITLEGPENTQTLKENWTVRDGDSLRVDVLGQRELKDRVRFTNIYIKNAKYYVGDDKKLKTKKLTHEFLEPLFYIRTKRSFAERLVELGILPSLYLSQKATAFTMESPPPEKPAYLNFSRSGGAINYAIGLVPQTSESVSPRIWIEQDKFVIRKIRLRNQIELVADDYNEYSHGLQLPKNRTLQMGSVKVQMKVLSVKNFPVGPVTRSSLSTNSLKDVREAGVITANQLGDPMVIEFYSRFR